MITRIQLNEIIRKSMLPQVTSLMKNAYTLNKKVTKNPLGRRGKCLEPINTVTSFLDETIRLLDDLKDATE